VSTSAGFSQQLFSALQESEVRGLQIAPGWRHALPFEQRPYSAVGDDFEHTTSPSNGGSEPAAPQQSSVVRQTSPVGLQPEGGWHTRNPFSAPKKPQDREQQL